MGKLSLLGDYNFTSKVTDAIRKERPDAFVSDFWSSTAENTDGMPFFAEISMGEKIVNVLLTCEPKQPKIKGRCEIDFEIIGDKINQQMKSQFFTIFRDLYPKTSVKYDFILK